MNKRQHLFFFVLLLMFIPAIFSQTPKPQILTFKELRHYDPKHETFRINGYVMDIYKCPPCLPQTMCKPCIPDNITLGETPEWKDSVPAARLRIYTEKTDKFELKKKYLLTVKVKGNAPAGQPVESVELIDVEDASRGLAGDWTGQSLCTIKASPCRDENVVYHVTEPNSAGKLIIQADKIVNGQPDNMGTLDCIFDPKMSSIICQMKNGKWEFKVAGDKMAGTLTLPDGRLFRNVSVTKAK